MARFKSKYNLDKGNFMNLKVPIYIIAKLNERTKNLDKTTWGELARDILDSGTKGR